MMAEGRRLDADGGSGSAAYCWDEDGWRDAVMLSLPPGAVPAVVEAVAAPVSSVPAHAELATESRNEEQ